ncbi:hypothetical protein PICMEDRAFT_72687 [Pichia membranifaciens NRRL Y-2026]|uniref:Glycolipid transfer protein domain-containing protein n=1 Tax=Pichia membranifaciens NRRL Y-2026 TaxID=763406 RepID=A0A1E3NKI7_9ASCO|nr:hypothetical protein PICMEDRAFT_72687 [Pichia membranifaciens NRRL Y-2026]ODQ46631.1 hypothetical protein PICMEDRAFT_72687 [Pichia membranifaciens NRRL Y-2026]
MTFFDDMKTSFADVPRNDGEISTLEFLEASESLVKLFDLLGSSAFSVVQSDMSGNINKVSAKFLSDPVNCGTLQKLILTEVKEGGKKTATQGLLWLTRGLQFTAVAMRKCIDNQDWELSKCFEKSYGETLTKYHSMLVRPVFKLAMKACPYRKDFFAKLGDDLAKVNEQLQAWVSSLESVVKEIMDFFESGNYGKGL